MRTQTSKFLLTISSVLALIVIFAFAVPQQKVGSAWETPAKYKAMKNPIAGDKASINVCKSLYMKHCASCHGKKGLGDGTKSKSLKTFPGDFSTPEFKKTADGVLFYRLSIGRDEMPAYDKKIGDEEDRWALVNYMKSL